MSNLIFKLNSKNQIGVGTNKIELTNSLSSALNIKKNDDSYSFLEFNTSSNTIGVGTNMAANDVITFKGTTKITTLSKGSLVYLDSSGNWVGLGTVGIGSYIQVNSGGTGLQWTGIKPSIALTTKSPSHNSTMSANSDNIILTFDEPIIAGTGNIVLTPSSGSAITIDVTNTSLVSFSSNVCTINPSSNLDATGLTYTVTMASGVIKNSNGDLFNGISGTAYQFNSKDTTSATVSNVTSSTSNGSYKADQVISIQVVFTETVVVTGTPQLTLETGTNDAVVNYASGSGSNTLTFTYTISSGHNSSDLDYKATDSLSLNGGTIKDAAGNSATLTLPSPGATGSLGANKVIVIDAIAPTVSNVTSSTSNGSYKAGDAISIQVVFTETVVITGTPQLTLETGTNDAVVNYSSGSSSNTLTFTYTISSGHTSSDLDYKATTSLSLNGGTIEDSAGNSATLTLPSPGATGSLGTNKVIVIDAIAPILSSASSIGTTTDTTPDLTFSTTKTGTLTTTISQGFSSGSSASITSTGSNTITFATLSNGTYSGKTITLTDTVGNISNALTIPTFTVAANPYGTTDIRYHMWNQNMQTGSETRGYVGYVNISCIIQGTTFYVHNAHTSWRGVAYFTTNPVHQNIRTSSSWWPTVDFNDGNGRGDEHTFKIEYNSTNNNYTITPDNSVWINGSYDNPFIHDMRVLINGTGTSANTYTDPAVNITHITGNKWRLYNATAGNGSNHKIIYGQKSGYYTTTLGYGYVAILAPTPSITTYTGSLSTYSSDETIFTFI